MNKQEAIEKIEKLEGLTIKDKGFNLDIEMIPEGDVLEIIEQIDEPEKPVLPQFVADWYEENKDDFERNLYNFFLLFHEGRLQGDLDDWFTNNRNKPIETLVMMHKFGYEVEKEKLYTVEIPNPNSAGGKLVLSKQQSTGRLILEMLNSDINKPKYLQLTEAEIKEDFAWLWQFAEEVEK